LPAVTIEDPSPYPLPEYKERVVFIGSRPGKTSARLAESTLTVFSKVSDFMHIGPPKSRLLFMTALSLGFALPLIGCGEDDGLGERFPVSGTVTYNGEPLKSGTVNFYPEDPKTGRGASGGIQEDGSYTLSTQSPGDGAFGGKYKVAISAVEILEKEKTQTTALGGIPDQAVAAHAKRKNLIPIRYSGTDTSKLTATVGPSSNTFDFKLEGAMTEADQAGSGGAVKKRRSRH